MFHTKSNYNVSPRIFGGMVENLLNNGFAHILSDERLDSYPVPVNIREDEKSYDLQVVAPGLKKEDFKLNIEKNVLTISFEQKKEENKEQTGKVLRTEYQFRSFKRSFTLNEKIDTTGISAKYADGILNVTLPKKEVTEATAQEITVA